MIEFTDNEKAFLNEMKVCRIATISPKNYPQVVPVIYVFYKDIIYFKTDYGTKKLDNIKHNNRLSLVVDVYDRQPKGLEIQGTTIIIEKGEEFIAIEKALEHKFSYYKSNPFKEGEAPIIKVQPFRKLSWGIQ